MDLQSLEDYLTEITGSILSPHALTVSISDAIGFVSNEEVRSNFPVPGFDAAMIDGYAVRSVDLRAIDEEDPDTFVTLPLVGEISAGNNTPTRLQPKQSVYIESGASMPALADAIIPERFITKIDDDNIQISKRTHTGDFIRRTGDDIQSNEIILKKGTVIEVNHIGLLAAAGVSRVNVYPKPRVSVISADNGLQDVTQEPRNGFSYDVNSYSLAASAKNSGAEVNRMGVLPSDKTLAQEMLNSAADKSEVIIISGAARGRNALKVQNMLSKIGDISIKRIAMQPGSLQGFGTIGTDKVPVFLLPSDPVACLMIFEIFIRPVIKLSLGRKNPLRRTIKAKTLGRLKSSENKVGFIQSQLLRDENTGEYFVKPIENIDSPGTRNLVGISNANCYVILPKGVSKVEKNELVDVSFLGQAN